MKAGKTGRYIVVSRWDHSWGGNKHYIHDTVENRTREQSYTSAIRAAAIAEMLEREAAALTEEGRHE